MRPPIKGKFEPRSGVTGNSQEPPGHATNCRFSARMHWSDGTRGVGSRERQSRLDLRSAAGKSGADPQDCCHLASVSHAPGSEGVRHRGDAAAMTGRRGWSDIEKWSVVDLDGERRTSAELSTIAAGARRWRTSAVSCTSVAGTSWRRTSATSHNSRHEPPAVPRCCRVALASLVSSLRGERGQGDAAAILRVGPWFACCRAAGP